MITVATYATKRYAYALPNFGRRVGSALSYAKDYSGTFIFIADESAEIAELANRYVKAMLPSGWGFELIQMPLDDEGLSNYKVDAQLLIAQMQSEAMTLARQIRSEYFWSLESDVLIPHNALNVSMDCLKFDMGYYDVAMCSYPSQGGGAYLGGRGDYRHHIGEDILESERKVPQKLSAKKKAHFKKKTRDEEWVNQLREIEDEIKECPPKGNVYELNAKEWNPRGWLEYSFPAIGKGAILPTDWVGMGCTLLTEKALAMAHFDGYEGKGTQDLYLGWHRWKPHGLNLCVTTHAICDHVVRRRKDKEQDFDDIFIVNAYHEPDGKYVGHLRQRHSPFYTFEAGEKCQQNVSADEDPHK